MAARIQFKRGLAASWTSANPTLYVGECGFEIDTGKLKVGNGVTSWNSLPYFFGDISGANLADFGDVSGATPNTGNFLKYDGSSWGPYNIVPSDISGVTASAEEINLLDGVTATTAEINYIDGVTSSIQTQINSKAPIDNAALTGTPTAPTAAASTNTTQIATTAFVQQEIGSLIDGAPSALNTLNELAAAINDDSSYASTITSALSLKAPLESPTFTGTVTIPSKTALPSPILTLDATPSTVDGRISWDAVGKKIIVGNGSTTLDFTSDTISTNSQTASYTLVLSDKGKLIEIDNASANTLTVPLNSSVAFPIGTQITILQTGAGTTTIAGASGVTVNATPGLILRARWSSATLIKRNTDTWVALGDLRA